MLAASAQAWVTFGPAACSEPSVRVVENRTFARGADVSELAPEKNAF